MTPIEALKLALTKEDTSIKMYRDLATQHSAIRDLLLQLANEEEKHKKLIEEKIVDLRI